MIDHKAIDEYVIIPIKPKPALVYRGWIVDVVNSWIRTHRNRNSTASKQFWKPGVECKANRCIGKFTNPIDSSKPGWTVIETEISVELQYIPSSAFLTVVYTYGCADLAACGALLAGVGFWVVEEVLKAYTISAHLDRVRYALGTVTPDVAELTFLVLTGDTVDCIVTSY
jgi:hypothetical protein